MRRCRTPIVVHPSLLAIFLTACGGVAFMEPPDGGSGGNAGASGASGHAGSTNSGGAAGTGSGGSGGTSGSGGSGGTSGSGGSGGTSGSGGSGGTSGSGGTFGAGGMAGAPAGGGGSTGVGGSGGAGGRDGGPDASNCSNATVTFQLLVAQPPTTNGYCVGTACSGSWLTIKTASGDPLTAFRPFCTPLCDACGPVACPAIACVAPHAVAPTGETMTWDGTYYVNSACGAGLTCATPQCMRPGTALIATMCASPRLDPDGGPYCYGGFQTPECVDVPFEYPSGAPVQGWIGPAR
jgi:hypothetical protein